jgi:hypothetical protein
MGRLHTRYSPVRRSPSCIATNVAPRLACVRPAASVHPEPGSNSSLYIVLLPFYWYTISTVFFLPLRFLFTSYLFLLNLFNELVSFCSYPTLFFGTAKIYTIFYFSKFIFIFPLNFLDFYCNSMSCAVFPGLSYNSAF